MHQAVKIPGFKILIQKTAKFYDSHWRTGLLSTFEQKRTLLIFYKRRGGMLEIICEVVPNPILYVIFSGSRILLSLSYLQFASPVSKFLSKIHKSLIKEVCFCINQDDLKITISLHYLLPFLAVSQDSSHILSQSTLEIPPNVNLRSSYYQSTSFTIVFCSAKTNPSYSPIRTIDDYCLSLLESYLKIILLEIFPHFFDEFIPANHEIFRVMCFYD